MICVGDSWKETIKAETVIIYGSKMNCVLYNFMGCYLFSKFRRVNTYENFFFFQRQGVCSHPVADCFWTVWILRGNVDSVLDLQVHLMITRPK